MDLNLFHYSIQVLDAAEKLKKIHPYLNLKEALEVVEIGVEHAKADMLQKIYHEGLEVYTKTEVPLLMCESEIKVDLSGGGRCFGKARRLNKMQKREILFRGQTRRFGEKVNITSGEPMESNWVYGGIFPNNDGGDFAIIYQQEPEIKKFSVYADTVGQYTGLTDKNGVKIFEGDIVRNEWCFLRGNSVVKFGEYQTQEYYKEHYGFYLEHLYPREKAYIRKDMMYFANNCVVIGNIHDNPELIKE